MVTILNLPSDILTIIASYSDCHGVMDFKLVCKAFARAARNPLQWKYRVLRMSARLGYDPGDIPLSNIYITYLNMLKEYHITIKQEYDSYYEILLQLIDEQRKTLHNERERLNAIQRKKTSFLEITKYMLGYRTITRSVQDQLHTNYRAFDGLNNQEVDMKRQQEQNNTNLLRAISHSSQMAFLYERLPLLGTRRQPVYQLANYRDESAEYSLYGFIGAGTYNIDIRAIQALVTNNDIQECDILCFRVRNTSVPRGWGQSESIYLYYVHSHGESEILFCSPFTWDILPKEGIKLIHAAEIETKQQLNWIYNTALLIGVNFNPLLRGYIDATGRIVYLG